MYASLLDAPVNTELTLLQVTNPDLERRLQRLGLFAGGSLTRLDEEIAYHPARVRGSKGDVVVPAGLAIRIFIHLNSGERKPLAEMTRREKGHIETLACGRGCNQALARLGLREEGEVTFIRPLPHMDYTTLIDRKERTRLSEGEAARIWGRHPGGEPGQFYFARQHSDYLVEEIIGGRSINAHLHTHGVYPGCSLQLESIEQARELHRPATAVIAISSPGGLRLYLPEAQAGQITVRSAAAAPPGEAQQGQGSTEPAGRRG
jgi:Fe2+ transport system protein FeoA